MVAPFEHTYQASGQDEIDRIEAWLRHNVQGTWRMEFLGIAGDAAAKDGRKGGLVVRYRFSEVGDLERFRQGLRDGAVHAETPPRGRAEEQRKRPDSAKAHGIPSRPSAASTAMSRVAGTAPTFISRAAGALARRLNANQATGLYSISLERISENFGPKWQEIESRANDAVRTAIEKHLDKDDAFTKAQSYGYLLFLADDSAEVSRRKAMRAAKEIARLLVGEDDPAQILTICRAVLKPNGEFVFEEIDFDPSETAPVATSEAQPQKAPMPFDGLFGQPTLKDVQVRYCPVWDARNGAVITHRCMAAVPRPGGGITTSEEAMRGLQNMHKAETILALDRLVLAHAIRDAAKLYAEGLQSYLTLPIHFESLATTQRRLELMATLRQVPQEVAKCITYEIVDLPVGAPQGRIMDLVSPLQSLGRAVAARLPIGTESVRNLSNTGIQAVGLNLEATHSAEFRLFKELDRFSALAKRHGLMTYVVGIRSVSLVSAALGAGFTYVSGAPIAGISEQIERPYWFSVRNLYERLATAA